MLFGFPSFHILEDKTFFVVFNNPLNLKSLTLSGNKENETLASLENILSCFVKKIVRNYHGIFSEFIYTRSTDGIWR